MTNWVLGVPTTREMAGALSFVENVGVQDTTGELQWFLSSFRSFPPSVFPPVLPLNISYLPCFTSAFLSVPSFGSRRCKHSHVGEAYVILPVRFREHWMKLKPHEACMDYYHVLSPSFEDVHGEEDQPKVGSFVEVRVREHPPRWIQGKPVAVMVVAVLSGWC